MVIDEEVCEGVVEGLARLVKLLGRCKRFVKVCSCEYFVLGMP